MKKLLTLAIGQMECHPYDPDDFRRCYLLLLKALPQWREKMYLILLTNNI